MFTLEVQARDPKVTPDAIRVGGSIPAVLYGHKEPSTSITINTGAFEALWRDAGETSVIALTGLNGDKETLIRDVQVHPITGKVLHVDFYVLEKGKKITIAIPLEFVGESAAEKAGHSVVKVLHEIEIEVAAAHLPHSLTVDISALKSIGDHINAGDVKLPPTAELITDAEEILASVTGHETEPVEAAPAAEAAAAPVAPEQAE